MKRKLIAMPYFARRLKRLAKKYTSLASELADLEKIWKKIPDQGLLLDPDFTKFGLPVRAKARVKAAAFGL